LRILVVTQHYRPYRGGAAVMLRNLATCWSRDGHTVEILTTRSRDTFPAEDVVDGIRVHRLPRPRVHIAGMLKLMSSVRGEIRRRARDFDVVVASILQHMTAAAVDGARSASLPVVARTEGAGRTGDVGWAEQRSLRRRVLARCLEATRVLAVSPEIARELEAAGYPESRIDLVPNGVPVPGQPWSYAGRAEHRSALKLGDTPVICFTGRLLKAKGLPELLGAMRRLRESGRRCQLLLVGEGADQAILEQRARELGVEGDVRFVGWTEDPTPYLRASDVYVLPSHVEGRSTALLEALALGMPALASDIEANRGLVPTDLLPLAPVGNEEELARMLGERIAAAPAWDGAGARCRELVLQVHSVETAARGHVEAFRRAGAA